MIPISPELADQLKLLNPQQLAFFGRICLGKKHGRRCGRRVFPITGIRRAARVCPPRPHPFRLANRQCPQGGRTVAGQTENSGVDAVLTAAADYKTKQLAEEDILLLVTSTQGEGEPPEEALPLHKFLNGKKAPI